MVHTERDHESAVRRNRVGAPFAGRCAFTSRKRPDFCQCFEGQENGICGANQPGVLLLTTGLHTGSVALTVDLCDSEPLMDDSWEEIVEVSFVATSPLEPGIAEWGGHGWNPLKFKPGNYRVRYCARHMATGRERSVGRGMKKPPDTYYLAFWPAPAAKDRILKQTSETADHHSFQRSWVRAKSEKLP